MVIRECLSKTRDAQIFDCKPIDSPSSENLLHIAPPQVTISLFEQLSSLKRPPLLSPTRGFILIYGAFIDNDEFFSEGDKAVRYLYPHPFLH